MVVFITKDEAEILKAQIPSVKIFQTCKQKSKCKRKKRYVEETRAVIQILEELRSN